ncbi:hypothetical protein E5358_14900 [Palleniella muris]|uniref:Uncharacterized protein n=1 Tax=Palleniella muris TaxID=3038145 RepID=A0AC61QLD0_9BACT|nr:hypothetical protein [Palleniella muris]TGX79429.1 hypothetical protein E5358_14900 [Palleniella muris]
MIRKLLELLGLRKKSVPKPLQKVYRQAPKGKVVAKALYGYDMEFMYGRNDIKDPGQCPICHTSFKKVPNPDYKVQKKKGDVFCTYDGYMIVTEKFKTFCEINEYRYLKFIPLPKSPGYYYFEAEGIFRIDSTRRHFYFGKKQECCNQYDCIAIGGMLWKDKDFYLPTDDFIFQTDYWFGDHHNKSPLVIIGTKTAGKMKRYGLSGIYFDNVMG